MKAINDRSKCVTVGNTLQKVKRQVFEEHRSHSRRNDHLLCLALNEAEGLAWQTGFPELFFPVLAAEKARSTVAWQSRQQTVRQISIETALAV